MKYPRHKLSAYEVHMLHVGDISATQLAADHGMHNPARFKKYSGYIRYHRYMKHRGTGLKQRG